MPRVKEELLTALNNACNSNTSAKSLCTLAGLSTDGSQATKRARLAAIVEGPKGRQRPGWLDLVLQVFEAGARSIDDIDASALTYFVLCYLLILLCRQFHNSWL